MKITLEMAPVTMCGAHQCAYNVYRACHAKAITIGDGQNPGCDTFFGANDHANDVKRIAGVGACKVSDCQYNTDYECIAKGIEVRVTHDGIHCLTFRASSSP
jgi:hypothetical protein